MNFVLTGLMVLAAAAGFARVSGRRRPVTWFLAAYGLSILVAAAFRAGLLHFAAGALGFLCLALSAFAAARAVRGRGVPMLAPISLFSGITVVLGFLRRLA